MQELHITDKWILLWDITSDLINWQQFSHWIVSKSCHMIDFLT